MRRALPLLVTVGLLGCGDRDSAPPISPPPAPEPAPAPAEPVAEPAPAREEHAPALDRETMRRYRRIVAEARRAYAADDRDQAIARFQEAVQLAPDGRALCELGWVQFQAGRTEEARRSLRHGIAALPPDEIVPEGLVGPVGACLYNLGRLEEDAGDAAAAARYYDRSLAVRPGNRVVEARRRGLGASAPPPTATSPTGGLPTCASGGHAPLDLAAWEARVEALRGPAERFGGPLGEIGLSPPSTEGFTDMYGESEGEPTLEPTVETRPLPQGETIARIVSVRFDDEGGNAAKQVAVLLPRGSEWCLAGTLSKTLDVCSTSCLGETDLMAIDTVELRAEGVHAIRVVENSGACACGSFRGAHEETSFHGIEGDRLVEYLRLETADAWYDSPVPPTTWVETELELGGAFPHTITARTTVECDEPCSAEEYAAREAAIEAEGDPEAARQMRFDLEEECGYEAPSCEPSTTTSVYRYVDGAYSAAD